MLPAFDATEDGMSHCASLWQHGIAVMDDQPCDQQILSYF